MTFSFIQYTQPGWYFNLVPKAITSFSTCYYHPKLLPLPNGFQLPVDEDYETDAAKYADIGYRAWNAGVMQVSDQSAINQIQQLSKPSIKDEYRFVTKYWGKHWAIIALSVRLFGFKNPFKEIPAFLKSSKTKRYFLYDNLYNWETDYAVFQSILVQQQPLVTVIIPTLNRYEYLKDVMLDLELQSYKNFDVIVVDQTEDFQPLFYIKYKLNCKVIHQKEKLLWTARNRAIKESKADLFLFFDDDSRVEADWIEQHVKCLDFFKADISAGVSLSVVGSKIPQNYRFFRWADQFDSGNALVTRNVLEKIGLFDLQFNKQSMGDSEFGLRAYLNGFKSISNPYGKRVHLKVGSGGLREIGHWDGFRPKKLFAPKPVPSVVYLYKKYYPYKLYRNMVYLGIVLSNVSFKNKRSNNMIVVSALLTILKLPLLFIQFNKSLNRANAMLQQGDKIEWLP
ncbi:MAG: glycosyltransferase family 2 protein [Pedobacter sp.]|nr:glycosyltransferase family 2 protein [Chitinophagaceae bacterium]